MGQRVSLSDHPAGYVNLGLTFSKLHLATFYAIMLLPYSNINNNHNINDENDIYINTTSLNTSQVYWT